MASEGLTHQECPPCAPHHCSALSPSLARRNPTNGHVPTWASQIHSEGGLRSLCSRGFLPRPALPSLPPLLLVVQAPPGLGRLRDLCLHLLPQSCGS